MSKTRLVVAANVRARLGWARISGQEAARRTDMKQTTLAVKLRGGSAFTADELDRLAELLELDSPGVFFEVPPTFPPVDVSGGSSSAWTAIGAGQPHLRLAA